jgi:nuclear pore complex protein Nup93
MKEKREFLNNLSRLPQAPSNVGNQRSPTNAIQPYQGSAAVTPLRLQDTPRSSESASATQQSIDSRKAAAYANVVTRLNEARERSLPFKVSPDCCNEALKEYFLSSIHVHIQRNN